ncbi:MAG: M48 family metallopeptidase [Planctomycetota bacterium]
MIRKYLVFMVLFGGPLVGGCVTNPVTGKEQLMFLSVQDDIELGKKLAPEMEKQSGGRVEDAAVQNYINSVGQKLAAVSGMPEMEFHYTAVNDKAVNAFALPGGYVYITKGLLKQLKDESQLAGVLGHETGHVTARHAAEAMSKQMGVELLLSIVTSDKTPQSVVQITQLVWNLKQMQYSRTDENEADSLGLGYMVKAGYDPWGMVETMKMLSEENESRPIEFLSTHPDPERRMSLLSEQIGQRYFNTSGLRRGKEDYEQFVLGKLN